MRINVIIPYITVFVTIYNLLHFFGVRDSISDIATQSRNT